ncbi:hypothetical protein [Actinophytocola algeriensis]|uniref:Extracellular solute-binding protein n=1 Tax=Actinophytocola algeriensis TaxID=1768010 RepID=A0A7W7VCQ4_9PSEU|nr:hypothetical protein [Actinophytocola algeriensis]MBB4905322.1 hypothetical protein [Actinophytocola algeriensis]MBE1472993.1 hypothetical protein [Actinophytocola algeriensis]
MASSRAGWTGTRIVALAAGVVLIIVAAVVVTRHGGSAADGCVSAVPVRGVIGSEKEPFFDDDRVTARLACLGYEVDVDSRGSREMLDSLSQPGNGYAFAFPSSTPTAQKIQQTLEIDERLPLFSTPMAVATFRPIVAVLTRAGVIRKASDGTDVLDIAALLDLARRGVTWDRLEGNVEYPARKTVLLSTTDPQDSNSAIMYLSIASQVANGGAIVTTSEQARQVLPDLCRLIFDQGDKPETSQVLFDNYVVDGMGRTPLALVYEAQYDTTAPPPQLGADNVLVYPRPTVYSRHTLIPVTEEGRGVGQALRDDPDLVRLAEEHGFRPEKPSGQPVTKRPRPVDVVESPSFEVLETMLSALAPTAQNAARCAQ